MVVLFSEVVISRKVLILLFPLFFLPVLNEAERGAPPSEPSPRPQALAQATPDARSNSVAKNRTIPFDLSGVPDADGIPSGWSLKQWFGKSRKIEVIREGGGPVLHLISDKNSFGIYREEKFDIRETPVLRWKWKVTRLPEGGDVREKSKDDQAAQLYVMFPRFPAAINSRMVGYIWDSSTPAGTKVTSRKSSNTRYVVLHSGKEGLGGWVEERRNVYTDYKDLFGEEPPEGGGITLMIDSNDTKSSAESFFSDIRLQQE